MMPCFLTLRPGELLYSALARLRMWMGFPSGKTFLREAFGTTNVLAVVDLPSHLNALLASMPSQHTYAVDELINQHTLLPYYAHFLPQERLSQLRVAMRGNGGSGIHMRAGIMASSVRAIEYLRLCPVCVEDDVREWGESYWHRMHQLPAVMVCALHGVVLHQTDIRCTQTRTRYEYIPASQVSTMTPLELPKVVDHQESLLPVIAKECAWLLDHASGEFAPTLVRQQYRVLLYEQGFATKRGRVRAHTLLRAFTAYYSDDVLAFWGCGLHDQKYDPWLLRIVRDLDNAHHPLKHVLLLHFLGQTVAALFEALQQNVSTASHNKEITSGCKHTSGRESRQKSVPPQESVQAWRTAWLALCHQYPSAGVTELRHKVPALYSKLYRHDRLWLRVHSPRCGARSEPQQRVDWAERDRQFANLIPGAAAAIRTKQGRLRRVTTTELGKVIGKLPLLEQHKDKLPLTFEAIAREIETRETFAVRRLGWAADYYRSKGVIPKRWELIRHAGVSRVAERPLVQAALNDELARFSHVIP